MFFVYISCNNSAIKENKSEEIHPEIPVFSINCLENSSHLIFDRLIVINDNSLGYARIRNDDTYFHPGYKDNLTGHVKCGTVLHAFLPEIYRGIVDGNEVSTRNPYYIVQIKDSAGNICIGYIAGHVISELKIDNS